MTGRFIVEYHNISNEGRLCPRGSFDWPEQVFKTMRQTFQLSFSHDRSRVFVGTVPQVRAACRWLEREGLRVGRADENARKHPPLVCAPCKDMAYASGDLPQLGTPCEGCGEPLRPICASAHDGACDWPAA